MNVDSYIDQSYNQYQLACEKMQAELISKKEYRDLLFSAVFALKEAKEEERSHPYVLLKVGSIYMKAKKIQDNLDISFMDKETFQLTTNYNSKGD